jgi:hypothetical protein
MMAARVDESVSSSWRIIRNGSARPTIRISSMPSSAAAGLGEVTEAQKRCGRPALRPEAVEMLAVDRRFCSGVGSDVRTEDLRPLRYLAR